MADLKTTYLGLSLKNPVIAASSGLTDSVDNVKTLAKYGAGAVVLKSLFEEEIILEYERTMKEIEMESHQREYFDYFDYRIKDINLQKYLDLIADAKNAVDIPVMASINCVSDNQWVSFAQKIEKAGADALELNMFILPSNLNRSNEENEKLYFDVIKRVKEAVNIPVALKTSYYFSNLGQMIQKLSETDINGLVLFNRFFSADIDIDEMKVVPTNVFSSPDETAIPLRWIALMSERVQCDLAASTGIFEGKAAIKHLLAGAAAVQVASTLYKNGMAQIQLILERMENWMDKKGYNTIDDFRGKMAQSKATHPEMYERAQFMKYFSGRDEMEID